CAIVGLVGLVVLLAVASSCAFSPGTSEYGFQTIGQFFAIISLIGIAAIVIHILDRGSGQP
ncbi:MAG TPA: hypothetical protein VG820_05080, partial [Fimbriimonadaceae bacterium]|nr:hypothetical protein [Fimbriimonadaceae bacterium]